ncbi:MAG: cupin domain-containing protein [Planctomycetota bacterium]|nr:cupin domain-containing protein [Planctomycetota bacterium]
MTSIATPSIEPRSQTQTLFIAHLVLLCFLLSSCQSAPKTESNKGSSKATERIGTTETLEIVVEPEIFKWGSSRSIPTLNFNGENRPPSICATIRPGMEMPLPHIKHEEETVTVLEGEGLWKVNGKELKTSENTILTAIPSDKHSIKNTGQVPLSVMISRRFVKTGLVTTKAK